MNREERIVFELDKNPIARSVYIVQRQKRGNQIPLASIYKTCVLSPRYIPYNIQNVSAHFCVHLSLSSYLAVFISLLLTHIYVQPLLYIYRTRIYMYVYDTRTAALHFLSVYYTSRGPRNIRFSLFLCVALALCNRTDRPTAVYYNSSASIYILLNIFLYIYTPTRAYSRA